MNCGGLRVDAHTTSESRFTFVGCALHNFSSSRALRFAAIAPIRCFAVALLRPAKRPAAYP